MLGDGIRRYTREHDPPRDRRHIDHAALGLTQEREKLLSHINSTPQVHIHDLLERVERYPVNQPSPDHPRIVDHTP